MNDSNRTAEAQQGATILSKLSLKGMNAQPKKGSLTPETAPYAIARVFGLAKKHDVVSTAFGDSPRIIGEFEGVNLATGEAFQATKAFLPSIIAEIMVNALDAREDDSEPLQFAIEIGVQYSEKGATGYAFTVKPLVKTETRDALAHLRDVAKANLPALAAPVTAEPPKEAAPVEAVGKAAGSKKK